MVSEDYTKPPEEPIELAEPFDQRVARMAEDAAEQARAEMEAKRRADTEAIAAEEPPVMIPVEDRLPPDLDAKLRSIVDGAGDEMAEARKRAETEIFGRAGVFPSDHGEPSVANLAKPPPIYDQPDQFPEEGEQSPIEQETDALRERVVRLEGLLASERRKGVLLPSEMDLLWGKATAAYSSVNVGSFTPCDEDGNETGGSAVDVYFEAPTDATPVNLEVAASDVLPYLIREDGDGQMVKFHRPHRTATGDSVTALNMNQGTDDNDTWTWSSTSGGVKFGALTDEQYDTATHVLSYRVREVTTDKYGHIVGLAAEGALVTVLTAESCP